MYVSMYYSIVAPVSRRGGCIVTRVITFVNPLCIVVVIGGNNIGLSLSTAQQLLIEKTCTILSVSELILTCGYLLMHISRI